MAKTFGYGSVLAVTTTTGESNIGQLLDITGPGASFSDVDTTTLDSSTNYRTFIAGLGDGGEVTCSLIYAPTTTVHKRLMYYMHNRTAAKTFTAYHGTTAAGTAQTFTAHVKGFSRTITLDDVIKGDLTLKVTGKPGYTS